MTPPKNSRVAPRRAGAILYHSGLAVALVAVAFALTFLLKNFVSTAGYLFFYIAVVLSAWFGGKWTGGIAAILSVLLVDYFFTVPLYSLVLDNYSWPVFIEFAATAAIVGWFSSWRKQADTALQLARDNLQLRVEERTADLKQTNEQLLTEMAERRRAEDSFAEAQTELARVTRMSTLGTLAASISHEVNQPLAAVVANADACMMWLSLEPPNLEEARAAVDAVAREGTRASDVVRGIRAMFAKTAPEKTMLDVNELIREVGALMQNQARRNDAALRIELAAEVPAVLGDRVQLQQVVVNLVQNGIEAMVAVTDRPRTVVIRSRALDTGAVLVAVQDSGVGIDPKNDRRIFDSFFTSKARGMGMGLSISHSIIENHGGKLWAINNNGYGATLQFTLPVPRETVRMINSDPIVFVIDDDAAIREVIAKLISTMGLRVETFGSTAGFLQHERPAAPSCLVLDVRLPESSGLELQRELAESGIEIPIIFITGHADVPMTVRAMKAGAVEFLTKPFRGQDLLDAVQEALAKDRNAFAERARTAEIRRRYDSLTPREKEVFNLVVAGLLNKQIGGELGTSELTIKTHRGRVMDKMGAESVADLVRMSERLKPYIR